MNHSHQSSLPSTDTVGDLCFNRTLAFINDARSELPLSGHRSAADPRSGGAKT